MIKTRAVWGAIVVTNYQTSAPGTPGTEFTTLFVAKYDGKTFLENQVKKDFNNREMSLAKASFSKKVDENGGTHWDCGSRTYRLVSMLLHLPSKKEKRHGKRKKAKSN